jgi:hypothetical protein
MLGIFGLSSGFANAAFVAMFLFLRFRRPAGCIRA